MIAQHQLPLGFRGNISGFYNRKPIAIGMKYWFEDAIFKHRRLIR